MQFLVLPDRIECPICAQRMTVFDNQKYRVFTASHHNPECAWNDWPVRIDPHSGYAERINQGAAA
jgi:hypothetical protein